MLAVEKPRKKSYAFKMTTWKEYSKKLDKYGAAKDDRALVERAFYFAQQMHDGQKRHSGEPYINHPVNVSLKVASLGLDAKTIAAALLHDTVEESGMTIKNLEKKFGKEVAFLVSGVTKVDRIKYKGIERTVESIRRMFLAVAKDIRVVIIKLMDRLHNMETLDALPSEQKRLRIARESLDVYASIADRLGMWEIKAKLEDLAFQYVFPEEYKWLKAEVDKKVPERETYLKRVIPVVKKDLAREGLKPLEINARVKHNYSLWKKLSRYDMDWSRIYDLVALRIIVESVEDCYAVLGVIHKHWKPLPGRIKDYIALPKPNGYQSLHTTVFCIDGKMVEFQIRTQDMHREAEFGIAAHWAWEQAGKPASGTPAGAKASKLRHGKFAWVKQLQDWQKQFSKEQTDEEFLESLKIDFFKDRIFVLTPKGDVIDLPEGATPIDFAYHIHSEIGDHAVGAKVNGKMASFSQRLNSGDVVEILTQKSKKPSAEWLEFVKTSVAKSHVRKSVKKELSKTLPVKPKKIEIEITVKDRVGLLKDISAAFSEFRVNIEKVMASQSESNTQPAVNIIFTPKNEAQIEKIKTKLKKIKNVESVRVK